MTASEVTIFLLSISIMLFFAKLLGEFFVKLKQSAVIGEILAGIILGPTILGSLYPDIHNWLFPGEGNLKTALDGISILAVVVLLLLSGIEIDLSTVFRLRSSTVLTSSLGILLPFILVFFIAYAAPSLLNIDPGNKAIFALIIGSVIAISSLPVVAKLLVDLDVFNTQIGYVIISAAMLNDFTGWILFALILGIAGTAGFSLSVMQIIIFVIIFVAIVLFTGRKISNRIIPFIQDRFSYPGGILNFIMIIGFLGAALTDFVGVHATLGAFIAGIAIGDSVHLKEKTRDIIQQFITNIFAPLFFVSIGLRINFIQSFDLILILVLIFLALIGKAAGSALGARFSGLDNDDAAAVGFGMSSGSTMGIIIGIIALEYGLITTELFAGLVLMALVSSFISAPLMKYFLDKKRQLSFAGLLTDDLFFFTDKNNKIELITGLVEAVSEKHNLDRDILLSDVLERERNTDTGIVNYLAIPYARTTSRKPIIAVAINKTGLNFEAFDHTLSRVIVLLLTPVKEHELQLKLLADVARRFRDRNKIEKLLEIKDKDLLISYMRKL
jgi:Kef-type K+ transport system membrane component KefB/mannitol/fructose-specific phosphotransferase system IIA component (Ntr-type)